MEGLKYDIALSISVKFLEGTSIVGWIEVKSLRIFVRIEEDCSSLEGGIEGDVCLITSVDSRIFVRIENEELSFEVRIEGDAFFVYSDDKANV